MPSSTTSPLMIVGVGASAGGLSAFESFLRGIPDETETFSYVLLQHLDPNHKSELPGILQRVTSAEVQSVQDGMEVEAGKVYVIPSGKVLTIKQGVLRLAGPDVGGNLRTPIDTFLRSLAQDKGADAACVILSGTGTDGALGLKAIKEAGGICLVQDPDEAQYDGMPRAAILSDLVDVVGSAGELGERLSAYRHTTPTLPAVGGEEQNGRQSAGELDLTNDEKLMELLALLRAETDLDFSTYKETTILRRVRHRMQLLEVQSLPQYVQYLKANPDEPWTLAREFLISVTNFFRDPQAFEALASRCIPHLFSNKTDEDTVRVWVPGCATGEEAYSLLMLLLEHRSVSANKPSIQLFATDIDDKALTHAQRGFYPPSIRTDVSEERLQQFFTREEGGYRIRPELRESVLFAKHNLLLDPPFSDLDLISCRNLLIYLKPKTQAKVLMMFHYGLKEETYLFLGQSETPTAQEGLFAKVESSPHLYRARQRKAEYPYPLVQNSKPNALGSTPSRLNDAVDGSLQVFHRRLVVQRFVPPSVLVDDTLQIVHMIGEVRQFLQIQPGPPSSRIVDVIVPSLRGQLRAALFSTFNRGETATIYHHPDLEADDSPGVLDRITMTVEPVKPKELDGVPPTSESYALITFEAPAPSTDVESAPIDPEVEEQTEVVKRLKEELQRTRHRLEVVTEEYETSHEELLASNEELQSTNEELRSTMEELQTSQEELQSANEELVTVNQELKAKIKALNQRNSDIQNLMEATDLGTLFLNRDLELRRYTARVTECFNVIPEDVGRPLAHLTHDFSGTDLVALADEVLGALEPLTRELQTSDGDWYKLSVRPYRTVEDDVEGVLLTFFDVTDLKTAEQRVEEMNTQLEARVEARTQELRDTNEELQAQIEEVERARTRFQKLFQLGPVAGVITMLADGEIRNVNQRYVELTGYTREELIGNTLVELGILDASTQEPLTAVLGDKGRLRNTEVQLTTKEGEVLQMMVSNEVIDQDGAPMVLSLGVNITARMQAEEALRRAKQEAEEMNQLKTSFIANMSHEIRTPLTGIIGFAEILEEEVEDEADQRHVHYIRSNGRRLLETLDSVLDLARLDAEQITLDPSPVSLERLIDETLALFHRRAEAKGLSLESSVQDDVPQVRLDESAVQRVLTNLVGNALKFTEEGRITLSVSVAHEGGGDRGRSLRFEVRDTGLGMEQEFQEKLFDEFTQERSGMTRSHEGAGLGLAITQRLVHLMNGAVEVESTLDEGTTFTVDVPYEPVLDSEAVEASVVAEWGEEVWGESSDSPRRVLVIDDRPEVGIIVEQFLEDCEVVGVASAADALDQVSETDFDLALVDIQLGEGPTGMDLLPDLQKSMRIRDASAPIIAMTAHSLPGDRQRFLEEGFDHYLSKPFTRADLQTAVAESLRAVNPGS